jgi:glutamate N-acetyltransferase/amino-acid N-acetyltransferase
LKLQFGAEFAVSFSPSSIAHRYRRLLVAKPLIDMAHLLRSVRTAAAAAASRPRYYATNAKYTRFVPSSGSYPKGFNVGGIHCGVKKDGKSLDLALVTSELPCSAAAVFTKNVFKAAPVVVSRAMLDARGGKGVRGLVANSGCANAVTGKGGMEDAEAMGRVVDGLVGEEKASTIVMSTGVIGQR